MSRMKKGNGLLRFLVFAALFALVLTAAMGRGNMRQWI